MTATLTIAGAPPQEPTMNQPARRITPRPLSRTPADLVKWFRDNCPQCNADNGLCGACAAVVGEVTAEIRRRQQQAGDTEESSA